MKILNNLGHHNHHIALRDAFALADEVLLVSPFLAQEMGALLAEFPSPHLRKFTLVTQLQGYSIDQLSKVDSLVSAFKYFSELKPIRPELTIRLNNALHGKIYVFFRNNSPLLGIVGSANFTNRGLSKNHEWSISIDDTAVLVELKSQVFDSLPKSAPLTEADLNQLVEARDKFLKQQPERPPRNPSRIELNLNSVLSAEKQSGPSIETPIWLKPVGVSNDWIDSDEDWSDPEMDLNFSKQRPKGIKNGDIIIAYAVGHKMLVGIFEATGTPQKATAEMLRQNKWMERWPWYFACKNLSPRFAKHWGRNRILITECADSFKRNNPNQPITAAGGFTLGALNYGKDKLQLSPKFGEFLMDAIVQSSLKHA